MFDIHQSIHDQHGEIDEERVENYIWSHLLSAKSYLAMNDFWLVDEWYSTGAGFSAWRLLLA